MIASGRMPRRSERRQPRTCRRLSLIVLSPTETRFASPTATLTAHITPGHTKGCTTWTMTTTDGGKDYRVMFYCSTSVVDRLVGNAAIRRSSATTSAPFARFRTMSADVFLSNHPGFFRMEQKRKQMAPGARIRSSIPASCSVSWPPRSEISARRWRASRNRAERVYTDRRTSLCMAKSDPLRDQLVRFLDWNEAHVDFDGAIKGHPAG